MAHSSPEKWPADWQNSITPHAKHAKLLLIVQFRRRLMRFKYYFGLLKIWNYSMWKRFFRPHYTHNTRRLLYIRTVSGLIYQTVSLHCWRQVSAIIMWGGMFRGIGGSLDVVIEVLVVTSWVRVTSGIYWLAMSVRCLVAPETSSSVSAGISISGKNSISGLNSPSGSTFVSRPPLARDLVTMAEDGPAPGWVTAGVAIWPGPPDGSPTRRIGRCDLRYALDLGPFLEPAIIDDLLTSLEQFAQSAEARKWLLTVTASSENTDLLWGNEGIYCGNFLTLN